MNFNAVYFLGAGGIGMAAVGTDFPRKGPFLAT